MNLETSTASQSANPVSQERANSVATQHISKSELRAILAFKQGTRKLKKQALVTEYGGVYWVATPLTLDNVVIPKNTERIFYATARDLIYDYSRRMALCTPFIWNNILVEYVLDSVNYSVPTIKPSKHISESPTLETKVAKVSEDATPETTKIGNADYINPFYSAVVNNIIEIGLRPVILEALKEIWTEDSSQARCISLTDDIVNKVNSRMNEIIGRFTV